MVMEKSVMGIRSPSLSNHPLIPHCFKVEIKKTGLIEIQVVFCE